MKTSILTLFVAAHGFMAPLVLGQAEAPAEKGFSATFTLSNSSKFPWTTKTATRNVDGLTITFPEDEADVVDLLLPDIAKYRAIRKEGAKEETQAVVKLLSAEAVRNNLRKQIPNLLAVKAVDEKAFDLRFDAALKEVVKFVEQWETWSSDLSAVNFWNTATGRTYNQGERAVFPEIGYGANEKGGTEFSITPPQFQQAIGIDLMSRSVTKSFRLDLPLYYTPGTPAAEVVDMDRNLLREMPGALQKVVPQLGDTASTMLMEAVLQAEIKAAYFTPAAAGTPEGEMLIRGLTRLYLFVALKAVGKITEANLSQMVNQMLFYPVPEDEAAAAKFLRAFETLDPFSGKLPPRDQGSAGDPRWRAAASLPTRCSSWRRPWNPTAAPFCKSCGAMEVFPAMASRARRSLARRWKPPTRRNSKTLFWKPGRNSSPPPKRKSRRGRRKRNPLRLR